MLTICLTPHLLLWKTYFRKNKKSLLPGVQILARVISSLSIMKVSGILLLLILQLFLLIWMMSIPLFYLSIQIWNPELSASGQDEKVLSTTKNYGETELLPIFSSALYFMCELFECKLTRSHWCLPALPHRQTSCIFLLNLLDRNKHLWP